MPGTATKDEGEVDIGPMDRRQDERPVGRDELASFDPHAHHGAVEAEPEPGNPCIEPAAEPVRWFERVLLQAHASRSDRQVRFLGVARLAAHPNRSTICSTISSTLRSLVSTETASSARDSGLATRFESNVSRRARSAATVS